MGFTDRLRHAWNAFTSGDANPVTLNGAELGSSYSYRPDRASYRFANERTIVPAIYNRMGIDIAMIPVRHVRLDENRQYREDMDSGIQNCLTVEANIDQGSTAFRLDLVQSLFDWGCVAILPVDTTISPLTSGGYDITSMRVGRVLDWYPKHVKIRAYNEQTGMQQDVTVPKSMTAIVENPLYTVMNERGSILHRLLRKLSLLDAVDEQSASGKLDIIIQLPYVIKTPQRREEAKKRLQEIEFQLKGSQHGIAYTDGTEKVVQLNRPVENNLMAQVEYLTKLLYAQLGITEEVMNGTADEATMINYHNRSIKPILTAICEAMTRTFLTKTARSQGQTISFFRNPFELVPVKDLAEIADKFTRNEVLSSNEVRSIIAFRPSKDPKADKLLNKNLPAQENPSPSRQLPSGNGNGNGNGNSLAALPAQSFPAIGPPTRQGANRQNGT